MKTLFLLITCWLIARPADAQDINLFAGSAQGFSGDGGSASNALLANPRKSCYDQAGDLYVVDYANYRIRKINTAGIISTVVGSGAYGYGVDSINALTTSIWDLNGVAVNPQGDIYFTDGNRIRKVDNQTNLVTTIIGGIASGYSGDGGPASQAQINLPTDLEFDSVGNLFICDYGNHAIRKIETNGNIYTVVGNGTSGFSGDGGAAQNAQLNFPWGLALSHGNIYICDYWNFRIRMVNAAGIITTLIGNGTNTFSGDGGSATNATMGVVYDVDVDNDGNVFIADDTWRRVRMITVSGIVNTVAGTGSQIYSGDGGPALNAGFGGLQSIIVDNQNRIMITDNDRIRRIDAVTGIDQTTMPAVCAFPNPSSGLIHIQLVNAEYYWLYKTDGQVISEGAINSDEFFIDLSAFPSGCYCLCINSRFGFLNTNLFKD